MKTAALMFVLMLGIVALSGVFSGLGCVGVGKVKHPDNLTQVEFDQVENQVDLIVRVFAEESVKAGAPVEDFNKASDAIRAFAENPASTGGTALLTAIIKAAGITGTKVLLAASLAESFLPFEIGLPQEILSERCRHLLVTVAQSLRLGAAGAVSEADRQAAAKLVGEEK